MKRIEFQWQVSSESSEWETIAETVRPPRRGRRGAARIAILACALVAAAVVGYLLLRRQVEQANRQIAFQIENVVALEADACGRGDTALCLAQQDEHAGAWYAQRARQIESGEVTSAGPVQVHGVRVRGDVAWVEVSEGDGPLRRMRFYRHTDRGWLHTAPDLRFWGRAVAYYYGDQLVVRFHERDLPYIEPVLQPISTTYYRICLSLACPDGGFEVNFMVGPLPDDLSPRVVSLTSPWLSGIPPDGDWAALHGGSVLAALARRVALAAYPRVPQRTSALHDALLDEYATWISTGDLAQAPLLGRLIDRRGERVLHELFMSLQSGYTMDEFLFRWLRLSGATYPSFVLYFETLLQVEREAMLAGRWATFALIQDRSDGEWMARQRELFERVRALPEVDLAAVRVADLYWTDEYAVIVLDERDPLTGRQTTFFHRQPGGWVHNDLKVPRLSRTVTLLCYAGVCSPHTRSRSPFSGLLSRFPELQSKKRIAFERRAGYDTGR